MKKKTVMLKLQTNRITMTMRLRSVGRKTVIENDNRHVVMALHHLHKFELNYPDQFE